MGGGSPLYDFYSWWTFRPRKTIFSAPPPYSPIHCTPSRPLGPSLSGNPPPLWDVNRKPIPPLLAPRTPVPLPEQEKKNPKRPLRIRFSPPHPTPEFLTKDFPSATRSQMEILTKENLVGAKAAPTAVSRDFHSLSKGNQVSLVRPFLSEPGSKSKNSRLGGWGWKNGPDPPSICAAAKFGTRLHHFGDTA